MTQERVLTNALTLEPRGAGRFAGDPPPTRRRHVYGGHLVAQALAAASSVVAAERMPVSLKVTFLRGASPSRQLNHRVRVLKDGGAFTVCSVETSQSKRLVLHATCTFQVPEMAPTHQIPMPSAPAPTSLPTLQERVQNDPDAWSDLYHEWNSFDVRYVVAPRDRSRQPVPQAQVWLRAPAQEAEDLRWHAQALAYVSDLTLLSVTLPAHGLMPTSPGLHMASLDHEIWFHRACRVDQWLLFDQCASASSSSLGLASGHLFTESGELVATVVQEGLIRVRGAS